MRLIDSCGWLQFVLKGPRAEAYRDYLLGNEPILVPTVVMYEVCKVLARDVSERLAQEMAVQMRARLVRPLTDTVPLLAADLALKHRLAMGDAIVLATAQTYDATLVTSDSHFAGMAGVEYLAEDEVSGAGQVNVPAVPN